MAETNVKSWNVKWRLKGRQLDSCFYSNRLYGFLLAKVRPLSVDTFNKSDNNESN